MKLNPYYNLAKRSPELCSSQICQFRKQQFVGWGKDFFITSLWYPYYNLAKRSPEFCPSHFAPVFLRSCRLVCVKMLFILSKRGSQISNRRFNLSNFVDLRDLISKRRNFFRLDFVDVFVRWAHCPHTLALPQISFGGAATCRARCKSQVTNLFHFEQPITRGEVGRVPANRVEIRGRGSILTAGIVLNYFIQLLLFFYINFALFCLVLFGLVQSVREANFI